MVSTLLNLFYGFLSSLAASAAYTRLSRFPFVFRFGLREHLRDLERKLTEMPFIYKDLGGDVLSDFVEVQFQGVNRSTLNVVTPNPPSERESSEKLKNSKKILFLGNAGVGKTTFQRHVILELLRRKSKADYVHHSERLVPIYVPLKAVSTVNSNPILGYITQNAKISSDKLIKLAEKHRLFLFLDGYDESPLTSIDEGRNFLRDELNDMMRMDIPFASPLSTAPRPLPHNFYGAISYCRVWLSSRREFFQKYPITASDGGIMSPFLLLLEIRGIGNNRAKLVHTIFEKYRQRSNRYADLLDEEYFIQEIDRSIDQEIRNLSYNPLFLTVMCYIYVKNVIEANNFAVNWPSTFYNLVIECIRLLLRDLDEEKARGLSGAPKEALLRRRNLYLPEKQSFLEYFAFTLFLERKTVFDLEYLTSETKRYFQQHSSFAEQCHILAELDSTNRSYPNFPLQLIFSGVFTIVDIQNGNAVYDFPHRRFKEVLACEFISTPERYEILLSNISDPAFSELKSVFMSSPRYIDEHLGLSTLQKVLDDARTSNDNAYSCQMSNAFMSFSIIGPPHQQLIRTFLIQCIQTRNPTFCLSVKLLYACKYDDEFRRVILSAFNISISETDVGRLKLSSELLFFFDKPLLSELISQARFDQIRSSGILLILIDSVMILQHGTITPLLQLARTSKELLLNVLYKIAVSQTTHDKDDTEWNIFFRRFFDRLLTEEAVLLFYFIWKYAFDFYALCQKNTNFQVPPEVFNLCDTIVLRGIEMGCDLVRPFFFIGRAFESRLVRLIPDKIQKTVTKKLDNGMRESTVYLIECNKDSLTQMISDRIPGIEYVLFDSFDGLRGEFLRVFFKPFVAKLEEARQDTELVRVGIKEGETVKDVQTLFDQIEDLLTAEALRVTRTTYLTIACAYQEGQSFKEPEIRRYFA